MRIEDKLLLREIQKRNNEVFEALFHDYYAGLIKFAEGFVFDNEVCEDIVQNIFIYIWENAEFLNITTSFKSYLYKAVRNRSLNHLRNLKIEDKHHLLYIEASLNDPEMDMEDLEMIQKIESAIDALPPKMGKIFRLKYLEEKTVREIAAKMDVSENTIKTQLNRAKGKLRASLHQSLHINFLL
ncbi:RNA polymerase sigma-70 factor [Echinicola marina]|uniref:RNA polymerase sigma-70 factor n=1 Tax=Echinicola marina TaxID=2859768 RepID=UPI001CF69D1B|nr:RNA polymerase sigma-70 factor [Echinicola marina]UCS95010.1 RNA polymerase sigma-70 factor [Echinicola marina]